MSGGDAGRRLNAQTAEAGRLGHRDAVQEMAIAGRPWGFDLGAIEIPVGVCHGTLDRTVPVETGEIFADAVIGAALAIHDDVSHLSLPVEHGSEILG